MSFFYYKRYRVNNKELKSKDIEEITPGRRCGGCTSPLHRCPLLKEEGQPAEPSKLAR